MALMDEILIAFKGDASQLVAAAAQATASLQKIDSRMAGLQERFDKFDVKQKDMVKGFQTTSKASKQAQEDYQKLIEKMKQLETSYASVQKLQAAGTKSQAFSAAAMAAVNVKAGNLSEEAGKLGLGFAFADGKAAVFGKNLEKLEETSKRATGGFQQMNNALMLVVAAIGLAKLSGFIKETVMAYENSKMMATAVYTMGGNVGYSRMELTGTEETLRKYNVSIYSSRNAMARWIESGLKMNDLLKLTKLAQDLSVVGMMSTTDALEHMILGVMTQYPRMLRQFGVAIEQQRAYEQYAVTIGKNVNALTDLERRQAFLNAVLAYSPRITGVYVASLQDAGRVIKELSTTVLPDLEVQIGKKFTPIITAATQTIYNFLKAETRVPGTFTSASAGILSFGATLLGLITILRVATLLFAGIFTGGMPLLIAGIASVAIAGLVAAFVALTGEMSVNSEEILKNVEINRQHQELLNENIPILQKYGDRISLSKDKLKELSAAFPTAVEKVDEFGNAIKMNLPRLEELRQLIALQLKAALITLEQEWDKAKKKQEEAQKAFDDTQKKIVALGGPGMKSAAEDVVVMAAMMGDAFGAVGITLDELVAKLPGLETAVTLAGAAAAAAKENLKKAAGIEAYEAATGMEAGTEEKMKEAAKLKAPEFLPVDKAKWDEASKTIDDFKKKWKSYIDEIQAHPERAKAHPDTERYNAELKTYEDAEHTKHDLSEKHAAEALTIEKNKEALVFKAHYDARVRDANNEKEKAEAWIAQDKGEFAVKMELLSQEDAADEKKVAVALGRLNPQNEALIAKQQEWNVRKTDEEKKFNREMAKLRQEAHVSTLGDLDKKNAGVLEKTDEFYEKLNDKLTTEQRKKITVTPQMELDLKMPADQIQRALNRFGPTLMDLLNKYKLPEDMFKPFIEGMIKAENTMNRWTSVADDFLKKKGALGLSLVEQDKVLQAGIKSGEYKERSTAYGPGGMTGTTYETLMGQGTRAERFDPYKNLEAMVKYVAELNKAKGGDLGKILQAYTGGSAGAGYMTTVMASMKAGGAPPGAGWGETSKLRIARDKDDQRQIDENNAKAQEQKKELYDKIDKELAAAQGKSYKSRLAQIKSETDKETDELKRRFIGDPKLYADKDEKIKEIEEKAGLETVKTTEDREKEKHNIERGYLDKFVELTGTDTEKQIYAAAVWKDKELENLEEVRKSLSLTEAEYDNMRNAIEQVYQKELFKATHVITKMFDDLGSKVGDLLSQMATRTKGTKIDIKQFFKGFEQENIQKLAKDAFDAFIGEKLKFDVNFKKNMSHLFGPWLTSTTQKGGQLAGVNMTKGLDQGTQNVDKTVGEAMTSTDKLADTAEASMDKASVGAQQADAALAKVGQQTDGLQSSFSNLGNVGKSIFDNLTSAAGNLWNTLKGLLGSLGSLMGVSGGGGGDLGPSPEITGATGGLVTPWGPLFTGSNTFRMAQAGQLVPGVGSTDSVPYKLTPGEYINDKATVNAFGPAFFQNLKSMASQGLNPIMSGGGSNFQISIPISIPGGGTSIPPAMINELQSGVEQTVISIMQKYLR